MNFIFKQKEYFNNMVQMKNTYYKLHYIPLDFKYKLKIFNYIEIKGIYFIINIFVLIKPHILSKNKSLILKCFKT